MCILLRISFVSLNTECNVLNTYKCLILMFINVWFLCLYVYKCLILMLINVWFLCKLSERIIRLGVCQVCRPPKISQTHIRLINTWQSHKFVIESRLDMTRIIKTRRACIYTAMNLDEIAFESRRVLCYNTKAFTQSRRAYVRRLRLRLYIH